MFRATIRKLLIEAGIRSKPALIGFTEEEIAAALIKRYKQGESGRRLCIETGIASHVVHRILRESGELRGRAPITAPSSELVALYEGGATLREIAAIIGSNTKSVGKVLVDAGVQLRPTGPRGRAQP